MPDDEFTFLAVLRLLVEGASLNELVARSSNIYR